MNLEENILTKLKANFGFENFEPDLNRSRPLYLDFISKINNSKIKIITIAGTNGKGQCSMTLSYLLEKSNFNVALWISPHVTTIRERYSYNNLQISYQELDSIIDKSIDEIKKFNFKISYYEFLFYVFFKWALSKELDYIVLEVGLGGRFDAVNHFDANFALITSISRDHQAILGNRYDKILFEKLGISRKNQVLLSAFNLKYLTEIAMIYSKENLVLYENFDFSGSYYERNIKLVLKLIERMGIKISDNLNLPTFKARIESIKFKNSELIFIGAHNPDGIRELDQLFKERNLQNFDILASFSLRDNLDIQTMLKSILNILNVENKVFLTHFNHPKAINFEILEDVVDSLCHNNRIVIINDWKKFLNGIENEKISKRIIILGSFYFIGEIQRFITDL